MLTSTSPHLKNQKSKIKKKNKQKLGFHSFPFLFFSFLLLRRG